MVYELYEATPTKKDLYVVPKAEHGNAYDMNPDLYEEKVSSILMDYIPTE